MSDRRPIVGASVRLYVIGAPGKPLGHAKTGPQGEYTITYTTAAKSADLYLIAHGGNAGGGANPAIELTALAGTQGGLPASVTINEATTILAVDTLSGFWSATTLIAGSREYGAAFGAIQTFIDPVTGTAKNTYAYSDGGFNLAAHANSLALCVRLPAQCVDVATALGLSGSADTFAMAMALHSADTAEMGALTTLVQAADRAHRPYKGDELTAPGSFGEYAETFPNGDALTMDHKGNLWFASGNNAVIELPAADPTRPVVYRAARYGFYGPTGIAVDSADNIWVLSFTGIHGGVVTEIPAADPTNPVVFADASYGFSSPGGIALDSQDNIWIANSAGNSVIELPVGDRTNPVTYSGVEYRLDDVSAIAVDPHDNVWVTSESNNTVTEIPAADRASPVPYFANAYGFSFPKGIASDQHGNIWVANYSGSSVTKIPAGNPSNPRVLKGATYGFSTPLKIVTDASNNVWVSDINAYKVVMLDHSDLTHPIKYSRNLQLPAGITVDGDGHVWVANQLEPGLAKITIGHPDSTVLFQGPLHYGFYQPAFVAIDSKGNAWVADSSSTALTKIPALNPARPSITATLDLGLTMPTGMAIGPDNHVWLSDVTSDVFEMPNKFSGAAYQFNEPTGIVVDGAGDAWVLNQGGDSITQIPAVSQATPNVYSSGGLNQPQGIALDSDGNIWVANTGADSVVEFPASDRNSPVTYSGAVYGFNQPFSIAVDSNGDAWIANETGNAVVQIPASNPSTPNIYNDPAYAFSGPMGFAFDGDDNLWITNQFGGVTVLPASQRTNPTLLGASYGLNTILAGITIDHLGNVWIANPGHAGVTVLFGAAVPKP